jgi:hypothetical protein
MEGNLMISIPEILTNSQELYGPIFVVGCPRSGTGVLARAIGLTESVCYLGESKLISDYYVKWLPTPLAIYYWKNGENLLPILKGKVRKLLDQINGRDPLKEALGYMLKLTRLTYDLKARNKPFLDKNNRKLDEQEMTFVNKLSDKYRQMSRYEIDKMLRIIFKDFQLLSGKAVMLEKTPAHALYIPTLQRIFPGAKVCHIVRDGRHVAASYMLNYGQKKFDRKSMRHICRLHKRIRLIDERLRKSQNPRYYSITYEDFITSPARVLADLFKFLDLPLSESVLSAVKDVKPTPSNWSQLPSNAQKYVEGCLA